MVSIATQLTDIYYKHEHWHAFKMSRNQAIQYHEDGIKKGDIQVYLENGEVLGYYERHFVYNVCFLDNVWIKDECRRGKVFRELYRKFWETMPDNIAHIFGEDKGTILRKVKISNFRRHYGYDKGI